MDIPAAGGEIEVTFLLDLRTGRESWTTWVEATPGTTERLVPTPPNVDRAAIGMPGVLTALAWHYDADGDVIFAHSSPSIPVNVNAGTLAARVVTPIRSTVEVGGVVIDAVDEGGVGTSVVVVGPRQYPADELTVDRE